MSMADRSKILDIVIQARDEASAVFKHLGDQAGNSGDQAQNAGNKFGGLWGQFAIGNLVANGVTTALGFVKDQFGSVFTAADQLNQVEAQLNSVLQSTGGIAGVTAKQANDLADEISRTTPISKEAVLSAENMALTFKGISKDTFPAATNAIIGMATAMNGGAVPSLQMTQQAALQVGKALNDPATGLQMLRREGVTFTEQQKEQIKQMEKAGDLAGAQAIMIKELDSEFGRSAQGAATTYAGKMMMISNAIDEAKASIGNALEQAFAPFAANLASFVASDTFHGWVDKLTQGIQALSGWVQDLTKLFQEHQKEISAVASVIATVISDSYRILMTVLGTLLKTLGDVIGFFEKNRVALFALGGAIAAVGTAYLVSLIPAMVTAAGASVASAAAFIAPWVIALGPIVAIGAALGAIGYELVTHWSDITKFFSDIWQQITNIFSAGINWLKANWGLVVGILINPIGTAVIEIIRNRDAIGRAFGQMLSGATNVAKGWAGDIVQAIKNGLISLFNWDIAQIMDWGKALETWGKAIQKWFTELPDKVTKSLNDWWSAIKKWINDEPAKISQELTGWWNAIHGWFASIPGRVSHDLEQWWATISNWVRSIPGRIIAQLESWKNAIGDWFKNLPQNIINSLKDSGKSMADQQTMSFADFWKDAATIAKIAGIVLAAIVAIPIIIAAAVAVQMVIFGVKIVGWILGGVTGAIKTLISWFGQLGSLIVSGVGNVASWLFDMGKNIIQGLVNGIANAAHLVTDSIKNIGQDAINGFKNLLGIHSPSTVFAEAGKNIGQGLADGITGTKDLVKTATNALMGNASGTINVSSAASSVNLPAGVSSAASVPTSASNSANGNSGLTINAGGITVNVGMYAGTQSEKQRIATEIWQALMQIARAHNMANNIPNFGIRPL